MLFNQINNTPKVQMIAVWAYSDSVYKLYGAFKQDYAAWD